MRRVRIGRIVPALMLFPTCAMGGPLGAGEVLEAVPRGEARVDLAPHASAGNDLDALIALLGSADLATREEASRRIALREDVSLSTIEGVLLSREDLSGEQRARLHSIARELFDRGPRAGMGVQFGPIAPEGVQIAATVAGFDAARALLAQDVLHEVDGRRVNSSEMIRAEILSREPGEAMDLTVLRMGQSLRVRIAMGSYADLNRGRSVPLEAEALSRAWRTRLERLGLDNPLGAREVSLGSPAPIPEREGAWTLLGSNVTIERGTVEDWLVRSFPGVLAGGQSRGGVDRFGQVRTRIGPYDAALPGGDAETGEALREGEPERKLTLMLESLQSSQRRLDRARNEGTRAVSRTSSPEQREALLLMGERLSRASREINEWIRVWFERADGDLFDG